MVARSYEEEQAELRAEYDGTKEVKIRVPEEPEVDPKVYQDVEALLFRGFLHVPAVINGVSFVLKSLNHHEFEMVGLQAGTDANSSRFYDMFLAYGVLMVNGDLVLRDRGRWLPEIARVFADMPGKAKNMMVRLMSELNRRVAGAVTLTEAYAMEGTSRFRWTQLRGISLTSPDVTGIPGTEELGLNWAQMVWRALNIIEDRKEEAEREWDNAKFIGSCFAGKGISKIYSQDHERRRKEVEERIARKDALIRHVKLGRPLDAGKQRPGEVVIVARTVTELADQLERSLKGEKDWHDQVVAEVEERARRREQERLARLRSLAEEREREWGRDHNVIGETVMHGLSADEVQRRVARRRSEINANMARMRDPHIEESFDKWLGSEEPPIAPVRHKPVR
jgi:hypothetical protein